MVAHQLILKMLDLITEEDVSVNQLMCKTGVDRRTIRSYLDLIIRIQSAGKIVKEVDGLRVTVKKQAPKLEQR